MYNTDTRAEFIICQVVFYFEFSLDVAKKPAFIAMCAFYPAVLSIFHLKRSIYILKSVQKSIIRKKLLLWKTNLNI